MQEPIIAGKTMSQWLAEYPLIERITALEELFWINPRFDEFDSAIKEVPLDDQDCIDAQDRLLRFAPYIARRFPETAPTNGIIESPLIPIAAMQQALANHVGRQIPGRLLLKCDSHLPISGSIKARGGIYEVLKHAETLVVEKGLLRLQEDYTQFDTPVFRDFFSQYAIGVGSTGNLGLSIGIMGASLGFKVFVHMSADARQWKKELLRSKGVTVIEHAADYSAAVAQGRNQARADASMHFVDDENSLDLFLGYAVAASRLKRQLDDMAVLVDEAHPLLVYLPCGVGGGAGGLTFGLKWLYGDNVHCFFAEPTHSPCMLLGLLTRRHDQISVQDFGIDNRTEADGLAVGRPSGLVGRYLEKMISGIYTIQDDILHVLLSMLWDTEHMPAEPSAMAAMAGPWRLFASDPGRAYLEHHRLASQLEHAVHIVWSTGGSMVPEQVRKTYYQKGRQLGK